MQEFSSISVSSYDAGSLADRLTEQSRDGWSVVTIVPTGSSVTAYLSRASGGTEAQSAPAIAPIVAATPSADDPIADSQADSGDDEPDSFVPDSFMPDEADAGAVAPEAANPVAEAPGWAAGITSTDTPDVGETSDLSTHVTPDIPNAATHEADAAPMPATAAVEADAAAGAAPAGWYADPSSRFELRYWDGGQWTEHVSRAGQQHTDPPVA